MSGTTMSTPRSSDSGNMRPASMTMMSSSQRSARQFMPNSPRPPRGMIFSFFDFIAHLRCYHLDEDRVRQRRAGAGEDVIIRSLPPASASGPDSETGENEFIRSPSARNGPNDQEWLVSRRHRLRQFLLRSLQ